MAEEKEAPVEVITHAEMAQLHPMEQAMTRAILAKIRTKHGDAWMRRNRETIRDQIAQVTGAVLP